MFMEVEMLDTNLNNMYDENMIRFIQLIIIDCIYDINQEFIRFVMYLVQICYHTR